MSSSPTDDLRDGISALGLDLKADNEAKKTSNHFLGHSLNPSKPTLNLTSNIKPKRRPGAIRSIYFN